MDNHGDDDVAERPGNVHEDGDGLGLCDAEHAARVKRILDGASFSNVVLTPLDLSFNLGTDAAGAAEFATFIGQGARLLHGVTDETRQAALVAFRDFFKQHEGPNGVSLPGALWLVSARA